MAISDRKLFTMWRGRMKMKAEVADLNKKIGEIDKKIIAEFERRGIKSLTDLDTEERITYVAAENVIYKEDEMRARLSRTEKGREILERCTKEVLDMRAIASEVQAGNIPARIVAAASEIKKNSPYLAPGGNSGGR